MSSNRKVSPPRAKGPVVPAQYVVGARGQRTTQADYGLHAASAPNSRAFQAPRTAPNPPGFYNINPPAPPHVSLENASQSRGTGVISRSIAQDPQWPLVGSALSGVASPAESRNGQPYPRPVNIRPGLAQPQFEPPMFNNPLRQNSTSSMIGPNLYSRAISEETFSPSSATMTMMSHPSMSSTGSIPDFPLPRAMPQAYQQIRPSLPPFNPTRRTILGPPPLSRRGNSTYYSNASFVSPIPEESDKTRSHGSYASSNAMPSSWGDASPGFDDFEDENQYITEMFMEEQWNNVQRMKSFTRNSGVARSASLGKREKAKMVTTGNVDRIDQPKHAASVRGTVVDAYDSEQDSTVSLAPPPATEPAATQPGRAIFLEAQAAGLDKPALGLLYDPDNRNTSGAQRAANQPAQGVKRAFSRFSAVRRPPRLDMDSVRDNAARGSLTSLPDLIKRATVLAAMIDNGHRPASTFDSMPGDAEMMRSIKQAQTRDTETTFTNEKHNSGISGMIAAFPNPGAPTAMSPRSISTPPLKNNDRTDSREQDRWPSASDVASSEAGLTPPNERNREKRGRRCCGLPLWGFVVLIIVLLIIVAAAIVIPLKLLILDKRTSASGNAQSDLGNCQSNTTCANGGTVTITSGTCACICSNGFTGSSCTTAGTDGCITMNITDANSTLTNVTLGSAISRLISQASSNFSIPLMAERVLAKLNAANLSCSAQNALVTYDGRSTSQGTINAAALDTSLNTSAVTTSAGMTDGYSLAIFEERQEAAVPLDTSTNLLRTTVLAQSTLFLLTIGIGGPAATPATTTLTSYLTTTFISTFAIPTPTLKPAPISPTAASAIASPSISVVYFTSLSGGTVTTMASTMTLTSSTVTPTSVSATPSSTIPGSFVVTMQVLDFARVVTLFVLQQQTLDSAITAQTDIQDFFSSGSTGLTAAAAKNLSISANGKSAIDLVDFRVNLGNGTVGARGAVSALLLHKRGEIVLKDSWAALGCNVRHRMLF